MNFKQLVLSLTVSAFLAVGGFFAPVSAEVLWSPRIGDLNFPGLSPSAIDGMPIGSTARSSGKFTSGDFSGQLSSSTGAPTIASGACGATTNGSVAGTNQSGTITIGAAATTTCTVSFSATLAVAPKACLVFPGNAAAAATGTTVAYVSAISTASFVLTGSALANTVYRFICL